MTGPKLPDISTEPVIIDREQAFLLFATFCGDIVKTSAALGINEVALLRVVDEEQWLSKLGPIVELKKSSKPGDLERSINRALNFVQAVRYKMLLERAMRKMISWTDEELANNITQELFDKQGNSVGSKLSTRAFADFASALEKAHALSYMALNDTASERVKRKESEGVSTIDMHARIAEAMAKAGASNTPRALLLDAQLQQAAYQATEAAKPRPREDDTFEGDQN